MLIILFAGSMSQCEKNASGVSTTKTSGNLLATFLACFKASALVLNSAYLAMRKSLVQAMTAR